MTTIEKIMMCNRLAQEHCQKAIDNLKMHNLETAEAYLNDAKKQLGQIKILQHYMTVKEKQKELREIIAKQLQVADKHAAAGDWSAALDSLSEVTTALRDMEVLVQIDS